MDNNKEKKVVGFAIKLRIIAQMQSEGYEDINDYIDALTLQIHKLLNAKDVLQKALNEANAKIDELDNAKKGECKRRITKSAK